MDECTRWTTCSAPTAAYSRPPAGPTRPTRSWRSRCAPHAESPAGAIPWRTPLQQDLVDAVSDFDNGGHDHRLATVGLPHPLTDRTTARLRDPARVGNVLRRKRFQLRLDSANGRLQRLGVFGETPRMQ